LAKGKPLPDKIEVDILTKAGTIRHFEGFPQRSGLGRQAAAPDDLLTTSLNDSSCNENQRTE